MFYETQRQQYLQKVPLNAEVVKHVQENLFADPSSEKTVMQTGVGVLKAPKANREEVLKLKQEMESFKAFKEQSRFVGRRERLFKTAWRHGIFGVDDADSHNTSVFYDKQKIDRDRTFECKSQINARRRESK